MKLLIIGEQSRLRRKVTELLLEWGHSVAVLSEAPDTTLPTSTRFIIGAFSHLTTARAEVDSFAPDVLVALPGASFSTIEQLLEFSEGGSRLVYCGSFKVYRAYARYTLEEPGAPDLVPLLEDDPLRTEGDLAIIERLLRDRPSSTSTILRLPEVFGPGIDSDDIRTFLDKTKSSQSIAIGEDFSRWRCATGYVDDVAVAIALAAKTSKAAGKTYNVADSFAFAQIDWLKAIARAAEWPGEIVVSQGETEPGKDYEQHLIVASSKIRQELGHSEVVPINEAFIRTVAWIRDAEPTL